MSLPRPSLKTALPGEHGTPRLTEPLTTREAGEAGGRGRASLRGEPATRALWLVGKQPCDTLPAAACRGPGVTTVWLSGLEVTVIIGAGSGRRVSSRALRTPCTWGRRVGRRARSVGGLPTCRLEPPAPMPPTACSVV